MPIANRTENNICVLYSFFKTEKKNNGSVHMRTQMLFKLTADKILRSATIPKNMRKGILITPKEKI